MVDRPRIDAFVTDGDTFFLLDDGVPFRCTSAAGPATQSCSPLVGTATLVAWTQQFQVNQDEEGSNGGASRMRAKALALDANNIVYSDDAYNLIVACPRKEACSKGNARLIELGGDAKLGSALALGAPGATWNQENTIFTAPLPAPGEVSTRSALVARSASDTKSTERIVTTDSIFWQSERGLHRTSTISATPEQWSQRTGDFAINAMGAYIATDEGLFRVTSAARTETLAAAGAFKHVVADARGVYATIGNDISTRIVDVRSSGEPLVLANVPGRVEAIAVAGDHVYYSAFGVSISGGISRLVRRVSR